MRLGKTSYSSLLSLLCCVLSAPWTLNCFIHKIQGCSLHSSSVSCILSPFSCSSFSVSLSLLICESWTKSTQVWTKTEWNSWIIQMNESLTNQLEIIYWCVSSLLLLAWNIDNRQIMWNQVHNVIWNEYYTGNLFMPFYLALLYPAHTSSYSSFFFFFSLYSIANFHAIRWLELSSSHLSHMSVFM